MKIGILESKDFSAQAIESLGKLGKVHLFEGGDIARFVKDKEVLFVRLAYHLDAKLLAKATQLKYICSPTTGLNHIDLDYCEKKKIRILSLKGEKTFLKTIRATPEHTLGLIIALRRHYHEAFLSPVNSVWDREPFKGYEIYKSKIGIIGLGRVGSILADYLNVMGAHVAYVDTDTKKKHPKAKRLESLEKLIRWADTIVLCANYEVDQGVILNKSLIDLMEGKYLINTARAELTDENFLCTRASQGFFKGLAIDVITEEQSSRKNLDKILKASKKHNIIITPHIGGATFTSMARTEEFIVSKLKSALENGKGHS